MSMLLWSKNVLPYMTKCAFAHWSNGIVTDPTNIDITFLHINGRSM